MLEIVTPDCVTTPLTGKKDGVISKCPDKKAAGFLTIILIFEPF